MISIPLSPIPSQTLRIILDQQNCTIKLYQRLGRVYCDLFINDIPQWQGVVCLNKVNMNRLPYVGFKGALFFIDNEGGQEPEYSGFNSRYTLLYLAQSESMND